MTTYIADWRSRTTTAYICQRCGNATNEICWESELGPGSFFFNVGTHCTSCCPHGGEHDVDHRERFDDDNVEKKRVVEVLCKFEITGDKSHVDKLTARVKKEMRVQFGNLYKEEV